MMQAIRLFGLTFIGLIIIQSCNFNKTKDSSIWTEKKIEDEAKLMDQKFTFIDYEKVLSEIKTTKCFESIESKYDFIFFLLLDSTEIKLIKGFKPEIIEEFRDYSTGLIFNERTVGFYTEKKDIKEIFTDNKTRTRIIECLRTENSSDIKMVSIDTIVYIKDTKAIFEISGQTSTETYFAKLEKNAIQIYLLAIALDQYSYPEKSYHW
jgi:hypothetical protein